MKDNLLWLRNTFVLKTHQCIYGKGHLAYKSILGYSGKIGGRAKEREGRRGKDKAKQSKCSNTLHQGNVNEDYLKISVLFKQLLSKSEIISK